MRIRLAVIVAIVASSILASAGVASAHMKPPHVPGPPRNSIMVEYTVQHGDTLWSIARRFMGTGRDWPFILDAHMNPVNPFRLHAGQLLAVPEVSK